MRSMPIDELLLATIGSTLAETELGAVLESLPPLGPNGPWIAGGALRRTMSGVREHADFYEIRKLAGIHQP